MADTSAAATSAAPLPRQSDRETGWPRLTLADQAFVNWVGPLVFWTPDKADRKWALEVAFSLVPLVRSTGHPMVRPIAEALDEMRPGAPNSERAYAATKLAQAMSQFMRWRGAMACEALEEQGLWSLKAAQPQSEDTL